MASVTKNTQPIIVETAITGKGVRVGCGESKVQLLATAIVLKKNIVEIGPKEEEN